MLTLTTFFDQDPLFATLPSSSKEKILKQTSYLTLEKGKLLLSKNSQKEQVYLLLSGKMGVFSDDLLVGEIRPHELINALHLLAETVSSFSIYALKESSLLVFPKELFLHLLDHALFAEKVLTAISQKKDFLSKNRPAILQNKCLVFYSSHDTSLVQDLLKKLTPFLNHPPIIDFETFEQRGKLYCKRQEELHPLIIYNASGPTFWTHFCLEQADRLFILLDPQKEKKPLESFLFHPTSAYTDEFVFLYKNSNDTPKNTLFYLDQHTVKEHHHIHLENPKSIAHFSRMIQGTNINVVLSGGGAEALLHIGILKALDEANIPIDRIGGTSLGAFFAAIYASGKNIEEKTKEFFTQIFTYLDFTFPYTSLLKGRKTRKFVKTLFSNTQIEDLWLPYFAVSTTFETFSPFVHTKGSLYKALIASTALPGIFPPVKYQKELHIDGSLTNIFPIDIMEKIKKEGLLVGIDVEPFYPKEPMPFFPSTLNGFKTIFKKNRTIAPSIIETLLRSTFLHSNYNKNSTLENSTLDLYIQPKLTKAKNSNFSDYNAIVEEGYLFAKDSLSSWKNSLHLS